MSVPWKGFLFKGQREGARDWAAHTGYPVLGITTFPLSTKSSPNREETHTHTHAHTYQAVGTEEGVGAGLPNMISTATM